MCKFLFEADNKAKPNSKPVSVKSSSTRVPSPRVAEVPKIAALYTSFSHRKSDGLFRSYSNRRSPSLKKQTSIPTPRMLQRSASISSGFFGRLGSSVTLRNVVQQPSKTAADSEEKPGLLKRLLPIWPGIASKDTKKQQTRPAPGSSYWMESRGAAHGTGDSAYNQGKELVGRQFMHVFASRNGWVIERWGYGNGIGMAVKMGEMLETIVRNATRPEFLHHELRVLALKHTQMGVTADMFDDFEDALFDVLGQVTPSCSCLDQSPLALVYQSHAPSC